MGNWIIRWKFDKESFTPGESATVDFWLENTGDTYLYLSELRLVFDFGSYELKNISGIISPNQNTPLGNVYISIPKNVVGMTIFTINYHIYEFKNNNWIDLGDIPSKNQYFINVYPKPFYKVFISRGLRVEDRAIGDPITEMIKEWGFDTVTVGIEIKVPDNQVPQAIKEEIKKADALIAIATPRYLDALTGLWRTLEFLHNETGIAFGLNKPLLILKERNISLGGLPSYLKTIPIIEFDPYNLNELKTTLSRIMPEFRNWIELHKREEFYDALEKILLFGAIVILSGIIGFLIGSSKK